MGVIAFDSSVVTFNKLQILKLYQISSNGCGRNIKPSSEIVYCHFVLFLADIQNFQKSLPEVSIPIPLQVHTAFRAGLIAVSDKQALVSAAGFEPAVSWSQATRFAKLSYALLIGGLYGDRTRIR